VLSKNSHFSLQDGHALGWASASKVYPQFEHFQLGIVIPPLIIVMVLVVGSSLLASIHWRLASLQRVPGKTDSRGIQKKPAARNP